MIDSEGYRANVGIILCNQADQLFWARRIGEDAWQFPQGGIQSNESPEQALFRELNEEVGLQPDDVQVVGCTQGWLRYDIPKRFLRRHIKPVCIGQKQLWYLLRLVGDEQRVYLNNTKTPEFDRWRWVNYWLPVKEVVPFKRQVYRQALEELAPLLQLVGGSQQLAGCVKHR
ncbi:MAG: RNA pyrophosphohydrolase [Gammaproteobacteria bacterium]|nr:RNA pyrophosphohydrolase [Gammaproteobacteria bacterium]